MASPAAKEGRSESISKIVPTFTENWHFWGGESNMIHATFVSILVSKPRMSLA